VLVYHAPAAQTNDIILGIIVLILGNLERQPGAAFAGNSGSLRAG
jgi:hypothetical protein